MLVLGVGFGVFELGLVGFCSCSTRHACSITTPPLARFPSRMCVWLSYVGVLVVAGSQIVSAARVLSLLFVFVLCCVVCLCFEMLAFSLSFLIGLGAGSGGSCCCVVCLCAVLALVARCIAAGWLACCALCRGCAFL